MENRAYYDDFAGWYERERGVGYHQMIDDLEVETVARYGRDARVLEVGCGTGLILGRVREFAAQAFGVYLSGGMLAVAKERDLNVLQGSATALPHASESFDVTYSFKVLPHIADIRAALSEMSRVTRPGGVVLAEFYNPRSLRYLAKAIKPPTAISPRTDDEAVYTRYDSLPQILTYLPADLSLETVRGIRVITPVSHVHRFGLLSRVFRFAEHRLADLPFVRGLGGFLVIVARKV